LTQPTGGAARLAAHLAQRGFQVQERAVDDQGDWLNQIMAAPPGAVVLNWEPSEERGWELMRLLKQNPATQDMPVVFYSLSDAQNRGAMFELDLLAKPLSATDLTHALDRQGLGSGCPPTPTVLIVDDDPGILDLHARIVQSHLTHCRVLKARNGREALDYLSHVRPDLVLLDLMMPEVDGFHVLEAMRSLDLARDVPVIVLTARILTRADMSRLQQGVAAVMGKGLFSVAEVLAQVEGALTRSKRLGSDSQRTVRQVMAYIHEHYAEPVTLDCLTGLVCLSERHLNRCFQQEMGVTAMTYLNRYRVWQARSLLDQGKSIVQVALAVGYADRNYFGRVFRKEVGVSPRAYQLGQRPAAAKP
jgi:DNA-binding response OmpR family regulator